MQLVLLKLINSLCYLYVMLFYKQVFQEDKESCSREFGGGGLVNDIGFSISVRKYGKWINK